MQENKITESVKIFFLERGVNVDNETDLFETGAIDSMVIIELTLFLEEKLGHDLEIHSLTSENFRNLNAIAKLIGNKSEH